VKAVELSGKKEGISERKN